MSVTFTTQSSGDGDDETALFRRASKALELQHWTEARDLLFDLARLRPDKGRYRALLAYARGHESFIAGDEARAREEWRRALVLDPKLREAQQALASRAQPRRSWVARLFGGN
jgi:hypothetical protein